MVKIGRNRLEIADLWGEIFFTPLKTLMILDVFDSPRASSKKKKIYSSISEVFELRDSLDKNIVDFFIENELTYPIPLARNLLFWDDHHPDQRNPAVLWRLLESAVKGLSAINPEDFSNALRVPRIGVSKLTQTLTLINATEFLPADESLLSLKLETFDRVPRTTAQQRNFSLKVYKEKLDLVREIFHGCELYEVRLLGYELSIDENHSLKNNFRKFFQISTNVKNDGIDRWESFSEDNCVFTGGEKKSLLDAEIGSVVFVRSGVSKFFGIGVVYRNEYIECGGWEENRKIHVIWVNKFNADLNEHSGLGNRFSRIWSKNLERIETVGEYCRTLEQLEIIRSSSISDDDSSPNSNDDSKNQILYGPPGTGKTWHAVNYALSIVEGIDIENITEIDRSQFRNLLFDPKNKSRQIAFTTFHQNYAYEDFIEGIRPNVEGGQVSYEIRDGIFKKLADAARNDENKQYVLIIDEINRGNIAKIFGELITLIEDSKRLDGADEQKAILPYSQESFGVPSNLYIVGTMNTADRSIQILDTALRRRFTFIEMMPDPAHKNISTDIQGINCQKLLESMNQRIFELLDRERQIGHTYFFGISDIDDLAKRFQNRIIPLLQEYFYDDWEKIRRILRDNAFVKELPLRDDNLNEFLTGEEKYYERLGVNENEWKEVGQYKQIYENP